MTEGATHCGCPPPGGYEQATAPAAQARAPTLSHALSAWRSGAEVLSGFYALPCKCQTLTRNPHCMGIGL
eukprot:CAMPEP_0174330582 /NCGR_PEP_ID=MMETSP0810-20121108/16801_1 /TAXON_ID=73025 ORGANISM="Eutreptiella gymnastica-like, Strain CCMP1594" /NCGR_SAMPLE_ID=MMETSP0810 /ASSEMBLY_ACC=CAM_ASM_000659 /LENGTH=69 /DNA_ID=CAMNT_0015445853 /DNA_START=150 /DNA_END=359 /DNA_ORIENTATION=+